MGKRVCFWGCCPPVDMAIALCRKNNFVPCAIFDNDPSKHGCNIAGIETISPQQLMEINPDNIVIICKSYAAVAAQVAKMGYPTDRLIHFQDFPALLRALGLSDFVWYYTYSCDGQTTCHNLKTYPVHGKVTRDVLSPVPLKRQQEIVARLLVAFRKALEDARQVPPVYRVGENWGGVFARSRGPLYALARAGDVAGLTDLLANFWRNGLGASIIGDERMFADFAAYPERHAWLQHNLEVWAALLEGRGALAEAATPPIGNPYGYDVDGHLIDWNSCVNHVRAARCLRLLHGLDRPVIGEIGGGFGGFAYQLLRCNRPLTYINFDLPENLFISSYYLSMAFPEKRILIYDRPDIPLDASLWQQYDAVMLPNFMLPAMPECSVDFYINTISFSEMEYATICEYFSQIDRVGSRYFYQENLSCHPDYKGFPSSVFPEPRNFRQVFSSFSPWMGLDAYTRGHSYLERLYLRSEALEPVKRVGAAHAA